jgi:hypothetical protein
MEVAAVAVAEDHQLGVTLAMIQTRTTIRKRIEKGIALPLVVWLHQQDTTGASLICLAGTQIPNTYEHSANISQKRAITRLEDKSMKQFRMPLATYSDVHPSLQEHMHISKLSPMPSYNGEDDLEVFMMWIHSLMCFYDIHQIVGPEHDHNRTTILCAALKDRVQTWYDTTI